MNYFKDMTQAQMDVLFHILNNPVDSSLFLAQRECEAANPEITKERFNEIYRNLLGMAINSSPEE